MLKLQVLDRNGKKLSQLNAPEGVFSYPIKHYLLYEYVKNYNANQRQGTASTKTRGEVRGGGRKPWRQKGTGRARAGSIRSPLWKKGGTTFGPKPRSYFHNLPKQVRKNALKSTLSMKLSENHLLILDELKFDEPKTRDGVKLLDIFKWDSALIVDDYKNKNLFLSMRNIPEVKAIDSNQINVYDILNYKWLVFTKKAFKFLVEKLER